MRRPFQLLLICSSLLFAAAAAAQPRDRIAVAFFSFTGQPLVPEAQAKLRASLRGGLSASGFDLVPEAEVDKAVSAAGLTGCDTLSCLRRIGELVIVHRVLKVSVEVISQAHVVSTLELIDLAAGSPIATAKDDCNICTMKEVNDGLSDAAATLHSKLHPATPPAPEPAPAPALPPPPPPPSGGTWALRATGLGAGVAGLGLTIFGLIEVGRDNTAACSTVPMGGSCARTRDTHDAQLLGLVPGIPLIAAGVVLSYLGWRHPKHSEHR